MIIIQKTFTGSNGKSTSYDVFGESNDNRGDLTSVDKKSPTKVSSGEDNWVPEVDSPIDSHEELTNSMKRFYKDSSKNIPLLGNKKSYELTKTHATDPSKREEMIAADKKHDFQESMDKGLKELKENGWKLNIPAKKNPEITNSEEEVSENTLSSQEEESLNSTPVSEPKEEINVSSNEENSKMSLGAKVGLGAVGTAAVGIAGHAAYKAWKKRKARKAAIDAEVNEFLKNNYKTSK